MDDPRTQLQLFGLEETLRRASASRQVRRVERTHVLLSEMPAVEDISFLHSGLCQTCLPHSRPRSNRDAWRRVSGKFTLLITPGVLDAPQEPPKTAGGKRRQAPTLLDQESLFVGVPYGPKARLILIYLQTEGVRSPVVQMGESLSAWMRSLGLAVTGGERGTLRAVREQVLRIARCSFTFQWSSQDGDGESTRVTDTRLVEGLDLWRGINDASRWPREVVLSEAFHAHLREHAVPLDKRAVALLAANSLGLDLYALFVYRLPRLRDRVLLRWSGLQEQLGAEDPTNLSRRVKTVMPQVLTAYPNAKVEIVRHGLILSPSLPAVPKTQVQGLSIVGGRSGANRSGKG